MERRAVTGRRPGCKFRIDRRTEAAVHCQEYDAEASMKVDRGVRIRDRVRGGGRF
jgi:hypothetical protein